MRAPLPCSSPIAIALAAAIAVSGCDRATPDASAPATADLPVADVEATDVPGTARSATGDPPAEALDWTIEGQDAAGAASAEASARGREAARGYMDGEGGSTTAEPAAPGATPEPDAGDTGAVAVAPVATAERSARRQGQEVPRVTTAGRPREPVLPARVQAPQALQAPRTVEAGARSPESARPARTPGTGPGPRAVAAAPATTAARDAGQARSLNRQAIALIDAGQPGRAIPLLERAAALQPRDAELLGNLGYAWMLAGDYARARDRLRTALELAPTRSATWLNLGQTYAELGQRDTAVDAVLTGYRYSSRKASVRAALQRAATGNRHSAAWREAAGRALARIG